MKANIIIVYEGERYLGHADIVSVHDGIASVAVKGAVAINIRVEKERSVKYDREQDGVAR